MKCEDFGKYLDNYEGLTAQEKTEMENHAAMCEKCQEELDFFLSMIATAKTLPKIDPPADFMETLNARLDAEDKKASPSKIVYHVRRNWKQYTVLAACFALVAVITANSGILLDRIEGTEDGVITEETITTSATDNGSAAPQDNLTENPVITADANAAGTNPAAQAEPSGNIPSDTPLAATEPAAAQQGTAAARQTSAPAKRTAAVSQTAQTPSVSTPAAQQPAAETGADNTETVSAGSSEGYSIDENVSQQTETASVETEEAAAIEKANNVKNNYSIAGSESSIAYGRYYPIDADGNPIMEEYKPVGIGNLKISSDDAEKAMEVIDMIPHGENGGLYITDDENFTLMLSMLNDEGVSYKDYTLAGNGEVQFRIVFN